MAVAVIVGIIFATFLTLVVVPTMYSVVDDVTDWFRRHYLHPSHGESVVSYPSEGYGAGSSEDQTGSGSPVPPKDTSPDRGTPGSGEVAEEAVPILRRSGEGAGPVRRQTPGSADPEPGMA